MANNNSGLIKTGSNTLSTTAEPLTTDNVPCTYLLLYNSDPAINMLYGDEILQEVVLKASDPPLLLPVTNANQIWIKSASGTPAVKWHAYNRDI